MERRTPEASAHTGGLVAIGSHRGFVAEDIVGVTHRIGGAALVSLVAPQIVFVDRHIAEGIGDGDGLPHHVINVGCDGPDGIGGGDEITLHIVSIDGAVTTAIDGSHAAIERIVLKAIGHTRRIHRFHQLAESVGLDVWIGAGGQQGGALGVVAEGTRLVAAGVHGDLVESVRHRKPRHLGAGGLSQRRNRDV